MNTLKTVIENVSFNFDWTYGVELSKLKKDIEELEKLGVTEVSIEAYDYYGSTTIDIKATKERLETDLEASKRILDQEVIAKREKELALERIERIKIKYDI
jgi:hypothetical protein